MIVSRNYITCEQLFVIKIESHGYEIFQFITRFCSPFFQKFLKFKFVYANRKRLGINEMSKLLTELYSESFFVCNVKKNMFYDCH